MGFDTDEKLKRVKDEADKKLSDFQRENTDALKHLSGLISELKDDAIQPLQVSHEKLSGKIAVLNTKIGTLAKSEELIILKGEITERIDSKVRQHEKDKHPRSWLPRSPSASGSGNGTGDRSGMIKISLPLKLVTGGFGVGGGGALIYWLIHYFFLK